MVKKNTKLNLFSEYATREKLEVLTRLMTVLPDPDDILAENSYDYKIYRDLLTDPHLMATIQQRKLQILQMDWEIDYDPSSLSYAGQGIHQPELKDKAFEVIDKLPLQNIMSEMLDSIFFGMNCQEVFYETNAAGEVVPVSLVAKPQEWFIFTNNNELRLRKNVNGIYLFEEGKELPPLKFIINRYHPTYINPYGEKILSRCYWSVTFKRAATEFWQLMVERYGMPFLLGFYPAGWTQTQIDNLLEQLEDMVKENIAAFEDTMKDNIELKESPQYDIGQLYEFLIKFHNSEISKAVLTVTLTTDLQGAGSYKAADIHKEMLSFIGLSDKKIVENGINRLLQYWTFINWGHTDAPEIFLRKKEAIVEESGERDKLLTQMGVKFTKEYFKKRYNLEDEDFELGENNDE